MANAPVRDSATRTANGNVATSDISAYLFSFAAGSSRLRAAERPPMSCAPRNGLHQLRLGLSPIFQLHADALRL
jgi:hypothetical protein